LGKELGLALEEEQVTLLFASALTSPSPHSIEVLQDDPKSRRC
jgi:hypothetical protein